MSRQPRSVASLAEEIRVLARRREGARLAVEDRLREVDLEGHERISLVIALLQLPDPGDPHPADLAVCAFVNMGYDDFTMPPEPPIDVRERLVDLRTRLVDLRDTDHPTT